MAYIEKRAHIISIQLKEFSQTKEMYNQHPDQETKHY